MHNEKVIKVMQALLLLSSLIYQSTKASQSQIEVSKLTSDFYTLQFSQLTDYAQRVANTLFCKTPFDGTDQYEVPRPEWLEQACSKKQHHWFLDLAFSLYIDLKFEQNPKSLAVTINDLIQLDSILRGKLEIKTRLDEICHNPEWNRKFCNSAKTVKENVLKGHEQHVSKIVEMFKWNDFLPKELKAVENAEMITFDGTDWAPLLKFVKLTPNELYSLDRELKTNDQLRQDLQALVAPFRKDLQEIESKIIADPVSSVKRADEIMTKFEEQVKLKLTNLPKINAFGKELFDTVSATIQSPEGLSNFYTVPIWQRTIAIEKVLDIKNIDSRLMECIRSELYYCAQVSPFPIRYIMKPESADVSRTQLWKEIQIVWTILNDTPANELAERVLFALRHRVSLCPSNMNIPSCLQTLSSSDQVQLKAKMTECFDVRKKENGHGPWSILPHYFKPRQTYQDAEQYTLLSDGYHFRPTIFSRMFQTSEWETFLQSVQANGPCKQVATETDKKLKDLLEKLKWNSMSSFLDNDSILEKFEKQFTEQVQKCIKEPYEIVQADAKPAKKGAGAKREKESRVRPDPINQQIATKSENRLFNAVNWLKVAVITIVIGLALLFVAAAVQYHHSQKQHLLED